MITDYIKSFFGKTRYLKGISKFAFWDANCKLSKNVYLAFGCKLGHFEIGEYSRVRHFSTAYYTKLGKFSVISKNSRIGLGQHPIDMISTSLIFYKKNPVKNAWVRPIDFIEYKPITIGNDVWIGEFVTVMGGVNIGDGSIVAARSVVTKDVPPYAIVAGIPARIVKYRFNPEIIEKLLKIQWWNWSDDKISENIDLFTKRNLSLRDINKF